jgi:hypothetical protein
MRLAVTHTRQEMTAYKRSINYVLSQRPVSDSPNMVALFPDAPHLLAAVDSFVETLDYYHPFRSARRDVIQYVRSHQDIDGVKEALGVNDDWIDQLFIDAMKFEGIN